MKWRKTSAPVFWRGYFGLRIVGLRPEMACRIGQEAVTADGKRVCHVTSVCIQRVESTAAAAAAAEIACCRAVPVTIHSIVVHTKHRSVPPSVTAEPCGQPL